MTNIRARRIAGVSELQDGRGVVRGREKGKLEGVGAPCFLALSKKQTHGRER